MKLVHALLAMAVISALENVASTAQRTTQSSPKTTTPGPHGLNLNGKMFTLSLDRGGISFFPPSRPSTPSYTTSPYYTNTPPYTRKRPYTTTQPPYTTIKRRYTPTTAPSARGVSVCLRYLNDFVQISNPRIFTLSPSSTRLYVAIDRLGGYTLTPNSYIYNTLYCTLTPSIRFWSTIGPDIWSRVCLTVDSMKNVAQMFSGSNISIRKVLPFQYVWSGEPVIEFPGFDGQVTDVQMWDYPLSYKEVFKYMNSNVHGPYCGSVLTWSSISYTSRGNTLLEDVYEQQTKQKISGRRRGRRPKGGRKNRKFVNEEKEREGISDQL